MDASCKVQKSIHVFRLVHKSMCPGFWVHIITTCPVLYIGETQCLNVWMTFLQPAVRVMMNI